MVFFMNKSLLLKEALLNDIISNRYPEGKSIPSRNLLCAKYKCSRTTVERAVTALKNMGILTSRQGGSTIVTPRGAGASGEKIRHVYLMASDLEVYSEKALREMFLPGLEKEVQIHTSSAESLLRHLDTLSLMGSLFVWLMPKVEHLHIIRHFRQCRIPQLLINRNYGEEFDSACTDTPASLREGLSWLMIEGGRELSLVTKAPSMHQPYLSERLNAFYECSIALGAHLASDRLHIRDFQDIPGEMSEVGLRLFSSKTSPRGIVVLDSHLTLPLVTCGQVYGKKPGRDYFLLTIDYLPELKDYPGVGMMRQQDEKLFLETKRYLVDGFYRKKERFFSRIKTELILPGSSGYLSPETA